jgi:uncharacterized delta-60 repeat protein
LQRYTPAGILDASFSGGGIVTTSVGGLSDSADAVAIQSNGKIVVAGGAYYLGDLGSNYSFALARYNANGSIDTSFGQHGIVISFPQTFGGLAQALGLQCDGKILAAGGGPLFTVARYLAE